MSKKSFLKPFALAAVCVASPLSMTAAAESGVSANLGISNIYLWRGQDVSNGGAVVHGGLEYGHSSGFYTGIWGSSESGQSEYDLYIGYGTEFGGLSVDLSYWTYIYPNADDDSSDPNGLAEVALGLGFAGFGLGAYFGVGDENEDDHYFTLSYDYGSFGILVGTWAFDGDDMDYTHVDLSYSYNDNLSFGVSKVVADDDDAGVDTHPLFFVSYDFTF